MRVPYHAEDTSLSEADLVSKEPFKNFEHWFKEAVASKGEMEANSMAVATADRSVQTAVRGWGGGAGWGGGGGDWSMYRGMIMTIVI